MDWKLYSWASDWVIHRYFCEIITAW
jgi:hypothetical protein